MNVDGFPVVNLNGTSIEQLLKQHWHVVRATEALLAALAEAAPHGRDYQYDEANASLGTARSTWQEVRLGVKDCQAWAEARLNDLQSQNIQRNGHEKAYTILRRAIDKVPEEASRIAALQAEVEQWKGNSRENKLIAEEEGRRAREAEARERVLREALEQIARIRTNLSGDFSFGSRQSDIARAALSAHKEGGE